MPAAGSSVLRRSSVSAAKATFSWAVSVSFIRFLSGTPDEPAAGFGVGAVGGGRCGERVGEPTVDLDEDVLVETVRAAGAVRGAQEAEEGAPGVRPRRPVSASARGGDGAPRRSAGAGEGRLPSWDATNCHPLRNGPWRGVHASSVAAMPGLRATATVLRSGSPPDAAVDRRGRLDRERTR